MKNNLLRRFLLVAGLLISLALLYFSSWVYTIRRAHGDFRDGRYADALADYRTAEQRLPRWLAVFPRIRDPFRETLLKQIQILYLNRNFEEGLEMLQRAGGEYTFLEGDSQYHNWYGNVLFQRTVLQEDPQALLDGFRAALREYQKALELDGNSWDARYNFELVKRLLTAETQDGQQKLDLLLREIRENKRRDKQDKLPPEKRS